MAFMARLRITAGESLTRIANRIYVAAAARAAEVEARHRQFGGRRGPARRKRRLVFPSFRHAGARVAHRSRDRAYLTLLSCWPSSESGEPPKRRTGRNATWLTMRAKP